MGISVVLCTTLWVMWIKQVVIHRKCCVIMFGCFKAENEAIRLGENEYDGKTNEGF